MTLFKYLYVICLPLVHTNVKHRSTGLHVPYIGITLHWNPRPYFPGQYLTVDVRVKHTASDAYRGKSNCPDLFAMLTQHRSPRIVISTLASKGRLALTKYFIRNLFIMIFMILLKNY